MGRKKQQSIKVRRMNYVDTLIMGGMINIDRLGSLYNVSTEHNNRLNPSFSMPIENTKWMTPHTKTPTLVRSQKWGGSHSIHTTKEFGNEYGYSISIHIPNRAHYFLSTVKNKMTQKQERMMERLGYKIEIGIPSLSRLWDNTHFIDFVTTKGDTLTRSELIWNYINSIHELQNYGIGGYDAQKSMKTGEVVDEEYLYIQQLDFGINVKTLDTVKMMELISDKGHYKWKNLHLWHNDYKVDKDTSTLLKSPNGIEFRRGKKPTARYKFYDVDTKNREFFQEHYYDAIYTGGTNPYENKVKSELEDNKMLRYEVSLYNRPGANRRIDDVYSREVGETKRINMFDILDNTSYNKTPTSVLRDGLENIFGNEIMKPLSEDIGEEKVIDDKTIIKEYSTQGLKYLGVKYLMDKGMSQDDVRKYLVKNCGLSYEVVRRLFAKLNDEGISSRWKDSHIASMDAMKQVYHGLT